MGFVEAVYPRAVAVAIRSRGLAVDQALAFPVRAMGMVAGSHKADLVVEQTVIVETKAARGFSEAHVRRPSLICAPADCVSACCSIPVLCVSPSDVCFCDACPSVVDVRVFRVLM
ncbi:GxxExxY protein [Oleisolibacter albus]|uniref:GxxExxY protein n=1 Tax=Oleisolibacter albus TaxID=2171757 RepID=UPI001EFC5A86